MMMAEADVKVKWRYCAYSCRSNSSPMLRIGERNATMINQKHFSFYIPTFFQINGLVLGHIGIFKKKHF
jgi:hypothetical protein